MCELWMRFSFSSLCRLPYNFVSIFFSFLLSLFVLHMIKLICSIYPYNDHSSLALLLFLVRFSHLRRSTTWAGGFFSLCTYFAELFAIRPWCNSLFINKFALHVVRIMSNISDIDYMSKRRQNRTTDKVLCSTKWMNVPSCTQRNVEKEM